MAQVRRTVPLVIKQAARFRRLVDPTYEELRKIKLKPNMTPREKQIYRAKGIHVGEEAGAITGMGAGVLGAAALGKILTKTRALRHPKAIKAVSDWVLPPALTYLGYAEGAKKGKVLGERYARKKLKASGNGVWYDDPLTRTERSPFDPILLAGALVPRTVMTAVGEKGSKRVARGIDSLADNAARLGKDIIGRVRK
jgi:hypothetical protein